MLLSPKTRLALGLLGTLAFGASVPASAQIGTVTAGYVTNTDPNLDRMVLTVNNLSLSTLTDVTLTETLPADPSVFGSVPVVDSVLIGTLGAGTSASSGADFFFPNDFGDNPATFYTSPFDVTVTGLSNGQLYSTTFSQDTNASGGFVGFEGIGENGNPPYQAAAPTLVGQLNPVPEASTLLGMAFGSLVLLGLTLRRTRRA